MNVSEDLRKKLLKAGSREEVSELLKAEGVEVSGEEAERIYQEAAHYVQEDGKELSLDELDGVSGGRDWLTEGCASSVKETNGDAFQCWSNDSCTVFSVTYEHGPISSKQCDCGGTLYFWDHDGAWPRYQCVKCGSLYKRIISKYELVHGPQY